MRFDKSTTIGCIIPEPVAADTRCQDSAFALQHPETCGSALIIKPALAMLCVNDSVDFSVFELVNGIETEVVASFSSSDPTVFAIGVNSGSGTAVAAGTTVITGTYGTRTVSVTLDVQPVATCCDDIEVETLIVLDNSKSMSLGFGGSYGSRLVFAKAVASGYGGIISEVDGLPKDTVGVWKVSDTTAEVLAPSNDTAAILAAIAGITQTQNKTDLLTVFTVVAPTLLGADNPVLLLISDCEETAGTERQAILDAAFAFKAAGGIVIVIAPRASGVLQGFDLAERLATGGFLINANSANAADVLLQLNYLKKLLCAGVCVDAGDRFENLPTLNYSDFTHWEVVEGVANLLGPGLLDFLPGNGLYVELSGQSHTVIGTIDEFALVAGQTYRVTFKSAGNQQSPSASQSISVSLRVGATNTFATNTVIFQQTVFPAWNADFATYNFTFTAPYSTGAHLYFEQNYAGTSTPGTLLDAVVFRDETDGTTLLDDDFDNENLNYIPPLCGQSASVEAIDDPPAPVMSQVSNEGVSPTVLYKYTYGYSWVTNEGETAVTPATFVPTEPSGSLSSKRVDMGTPPARATGIRLWRSLGEVAAITVAGAGDAAANGQYLDDGSGARYEAANGWFMFFDGGTWKLDNGSETVSSVRYSNSTGNLFEPWDTIENGAGPAPTVTNTVAADAVEAAMFLLAELPVSDTTYFDTEDRAAFQARYESSITAPTENTTQVLIGGLGYGYAALPACCYYDTSPTSDLISPGTTSSNPSVIATGEKLDGASPGASTDAYNACDNNVNTVWAGTTGGGVSAWWKCEFPTAKLLSGYRITAETVSVSAPTDWVLEGSNDDSAWTVIDTQVSQTSNFENLVPLEYLVSPVASYRFFRFTFANDQATVAIAEFQLVGAVTAFENNCPVCLTEVPGTQVADSPGLADIETGAGGGGQPFSIEKCVGCGAGFINLSTDNLVPAMTSNTAPSGVASASTEFDASHVAWKAFDRVGASYWSSNAALPQYLQYQFSAAKTVAVYALTAVKVYAPKAWVLAGSADGVVWTTLDTRANQSWAYGQRKLFQIQTPASFLYYRLTVSETFNAEAQELGLGSLLAEWEMFSAAPATACATGTSTAAEGQAVAEARAIAAATALLNCVQIFSATAVAQRTPCAVGEYGGPPFSASASRTSLNSQAEALADATAAAQTAADLNRDCTQSNNTQPIIIEDTPDSNFMPSSPYPSVAYLSGLPATTTKVVVTLLGLSHGSPDDIRIVLMGPTGVKVELMRNCGGTDSVGGGLQSGGVCPGIDLVFDDTGAALPDAGGFAAGTYRPTQYGVESNLPDPAPQTPYADVLSAFNGLNPNGSWSLWVIDDLSIFPGKVCGGWALTITP